METKKESLSVPYLSYFVLVHGLGILGLGYAFWQASAAIVVAAVSYFFIGHLAITVGSHRYFTHQAFVTNRPVAYMLAICHSIVAQGSVLWWSAKHFMHHMLEDIKGKDPHTPLDGFFHSQMGWLLYPSGFGPPPKQYLQRSEKGGVANEVMRWHHRNIKWLIPLMAFVVPALIGWYLGDVLGGILVIGFARLMVQYHATWIVNSVGHRYGTRADNYATNFGWLYGLPFWLVTVGEAWHANHHVSSAHWRLGRKWWQFDPGAYLIWLLYMLGLVTELKSPANRLRVPHVRDNVVG
jgi:stearoyl-CoA desaturase (delta-9 desaturase)